MASGDIRPITPVLGSKKYKVAASATTIKAGEPVALNALGDVVAIPMATNAPVVATHFVLGIATKESTNTAAAAGYVEYTPLRKDDVYLIKPKVAASFDTQAEYDALVGKRVLIDLTSGSYTILAADHATYGCVIAPLDITEHPGMVAFQFKDSCSPLA